MLNINYGHNQGLMSKCRRLSEYAYFVHAVRDNIAQSYPAKEAVIKAVDDCIQKNILSDVLRKN